MQRQRGELVPIGEAFSGLDAGPLQAIRDATPQARHHYTRFDQVNQLVAASETDPDLGFMGRMMALCSLPGAIPATGFNTSASTIPTRSSLQRPETTSSPTATCRAC